MNDVEKRAATQTQGLPWHKLWVLLGALVVVLALCGWKYGWFGNEPLVAPKASPKAGVVVLYLAGVDGIHIQVEPEDYEVTDQLKEYLDKFPGAEVKGHSMKR